MSLQVLNSKFLNLITATSFNGYYVNVFFDMLEEVMDRYKFDCRDNYNLDEIDNSTVQSDPTNNCKKDVEQVRSLTTQELGTLVVDRNCS